jgi:hypothetical protein
LAPISAKVNAKLVKNKNETGKKKIDRKRDDFDLTLYNRHDHLGKKLKSR